MTSGILLANVSDLLPDFDQLNGVTAVVSEERVHIVIFLAAIIISDTPAHVLAIGG